MPESSTDSSKRRRRWFGALCLIAAIAMLAGDELALKGRLHPLTSLVYWLVCFLLTILAIFAALADVRALRQKSRDEQRALFEHTLREIERERRAHDPSRPADPSHNGGRSAG